MNGLEGRAVSRPGDNSTSPQTTDLSGVAGVLVTPSSPVKSGHEGAADGNRSGFAEQFAKALILIVLWGGIAYGCWKDDILLWRCEHGSDITCMEIARAGWKNSAESGQAELAARALERLCTRGNACSCAGIGFLYFNRGLLPDAPDNCSYFQKAVKINPNVFSECPHEDWWSTIAVNACKRAR